MENYVLSEEAKVRIAKYNKKCVAVQVITIVVTTLIVLWALFKGLIMMPFLLQVIVAWLLAFSIVLILNVFLRRIFDLDYGKIMNEELDPQLFLEVHHGCMPKKARYKNLNMLNTAVAYINMGKYEDALNCMKEPYLMVNDLSLREYLIYLNNQLCCYAGMKQYQDVENLFAILKEQVEKFQEKTKFPKMMLWSETLYENARMSVLMYKVMTLEGRTYLNSMISSLKDKLEKENPLPLYKAVYTLDLARFYVAAGQYEEALTLSEKAVSLSGKMYISELARQTSRMIRDRDVDIALVQDSELLECRNILCAKYGEEYASQEQLADLVLYVMHEKEEVIGVAVLDKTLTVIAAAFAPEQDTDKNRFRFMQEMKRRDYKISTTVHPSADGKETVYHACI